jgi:uncharacterized RDD family membrane protein YckC
VIGSDSVRSSAAQDGDAAWRNELSQRLASYRARRRRSSDNDDQSQFSFEQEHEPLAAPAQVAVADPEVDAPPDDFAFTIAIGRCAPAKQKQEGQVFIDVSLPAGEPTDGAGDTEPSYVLAETSPGLYPVASMDERRIAALIDGACLMFAYGGFLTLFGSLGGQFTFSKMSAAVYGIAFAVVYVQYFFLFTVFGGTTPGMMLRRLEVVGFSGEEPAPRNLMLRAAGYFLSAGTFFLGFLWAMWDEDELTWHDRISHTYLRSAERVADDGIEEAVPGNS